MPNRILSIILIVVFVNFILAPTVISLLDNPTDVSIVFNLNEEENNEIESVNDNQLETLQVENLLTICFGFSLKTNKAHNKSYSNFFLKLHLPPPELS